MNLRALPVLVGGLILLSGIGPAFGQADDLEAEWKLLSTRDAKEAHPGCEQSRMIVRPGGRVVFELAGKVANRGELTRDGSGKRRSVDLHLADGQTLRGVYEVKDDQLIICFAESGQPRPSATTPKGTQWAETWQRVKP